MPLDDLAALVRALDNRLELWRDIVERNKDGEMVVVQHIYRGWFVRQPQRPNNKGEPNGV